jgi:two-component system chemotaxis sensor kinase CheA
MDQDFERELLAAFAEEAADHVRGLTSGLLDLENGITQGDGEPLIARVYRQAHSLKGAARAVGLANVEHVCHAMESVLAAMKAGALLGSPPLFDELQSAVQAVDDWLQGGDGDTQLAATLATRLMAMLQPPKAQPTAPPPSQQSAAQVPLRPVSAMATAPTDPSGLPALSPSLPKELTAEAAPAQGASAAAIGSAPDAKGDPAPPPATAPGADTALSAPPVKVTEKAKTGFAQTANPSAYNADSTVRVHVRKLEVLFAQSEELMSAAFAQRRRLAEARSLAARAAAWHKALEDQELSREAPPMCEQVGGMVQSMLAEARALETNLALDCAALERQLRDLGATARAALLQPFGGLFEPCHKVVRDLGREQGKSIELQVEGADLSVDRRVLEALRDPLMHLIRNACDHGVEMPQMRRAAGKPERAQIRLHAVPMGTDHVELRVHDDGGGMNPQRLRAKALALGLHTAEELDHWSDDAVFDLAFAAELSTASSVTTLSGRGLGLAIVRQALEEIGGSVAVQSRPGLGSVFVLRLPVSLSTFRGVLVASGGQVFAIPSHHVERVLPYRPEEQGTVAGQAMVGVGGIQLAAPRLAQLLGLAEPQGPPAVETAVVVAVAGRRMALRVDAVVSEEEGLAKGLGKQLRRVRGISGIANFAEHSLIPVVLLADLVGAPGVPNVAMAGAQGPAAPTAFSPARPQYTICIAEDSATARQLVVHVLRNAGYRVHIAENGADALALLRTQPCDALITDVEMPVLDGFGLTEAIRADAQLHDLPVVLLTSLESREYREKGAAVGANAYVVKRNFEPGTLLAALERVL